MLSTEVIFEIKKLSIKMTTIKKSIHRPVCYWTRDTISFNNEIRFGINLCSQFLLSSK